jgi:hypothetical protein
MCFEVTRVVKAGRRSRKKFRQPRPRRRTGTPFFSVVTGERWYKLSARQEIGDGYETPMAASDSLGSRIQGTQCPA